jgi:GH18 family chitinase
MKNQKWSSLSSFTLLLLSLSFLFAACSSNQNSAGNFKVIGYLFNKKVDLNEIPYQYLTDINYSFALPAADCSGNIIPVPKPERLAELSNTAHKRGVKVFISIGGWEIGDGGGNDTRFEVLANSAVTRTNFTEAAMKIVRKFNLDGVDIDWEYPDPIEPSSSNFVSLIKQLSDSLHKAGKKLSAAIVSNGDFHGYGIKKAVFPYVDWMNIMSYDYKDDQDYPHSPYWLAVRSFDYWVHKRGLPKNKAMLGLNFGFYRHLLAMGADPYADSYTTTVASLFGDRENTKQVSADSTITIYYNGIKTVKEKTRLALKTGSGIMMWAVAGDTTGKYSLLKAINDVITNSQ